MPDPNDLPLPDYAEEFVRNQLPKLHLWDRCWGGLGRTEKSFALEVQQLLNKHTQALLAQEPNPFADGEVPACSPSAVKGRDLMPPDWMWFVAFALVDCEWAVREILKPEFEDTVRQWLRERRHSARLPDPTP